MVIRVSVQKYQEDILGALVVFPEKAEWQEQVDMAALCRNSAVLWAS